MWCQYGRHCQIILLAPGAHVILITFFIAFNTPIKQHFDFSSAVISPFIKNVAHQVSSIKQAQVAKYIFLKQRSNEQ